MSVTGHVTQEPRLQEVEKLVNSQTLHGSESLCRLLRYLADHAIKHPGMALKEYQIATEVFGRPADFDPHLDSLVRVQAGRLRAKLAEYYSSEGSEDATVVELPKGSYTLTFQHPQAGSKAAFHPAQESEADRGGRSVPRASLAVPVLATMLLLAIISIITLLLTRPSNNAPVIATEQVAPAIRTFWQSFANGPKETWIIFSNGAFVGRPETGLRYFDASRDTRQAILDHYTGVGEVLAVYDLDHVFSDLHQGVRVKRGSLFSLDDAQDNNLIFVGSPAENLTLLDVPTTREFQFQRAASGPRKGDLAVVNVHPQAGEPKTLFASPSGTPLSEDYAIIGLVPGMNPARSVLILAGTTTIGTQAAAEYVCRADSLQQLLLRLSVSGNGKMKPFEAVIHVKVARGVPMESDLVALREVSR